MIDRLKTWLAERPAICRWRHRRYKRIHQIYPATRVLDRETPVRDKPLATFATSSGIAIPVIGGYRYGLVPPLAYLPAFALLYELERNRLLTASEHAFYRAALGTHTLAQPLHEVVPVVSRIVARLKSRMIPESLGHPGGALLAPDDDDLRSHLSRLTRLNRDRLEHVSVYAKHRIPAGGRILEVGFTSGGHSLFAFERLGFDVVGLDNAYDGLMATPVIHNHLARRLGSKAQFVFADATTRTPFDAASFDVVYSVSVLEHVRDVPAMLREMRRLLKPDGIMIHSYNPYFCVNGGHPYGILDSPWSHVRISRSDQERYFREFRPFETEGWMWTDKTLNRMPVPMMQRALIESGFRIRLWEEVPDSPATLADLTPEIIADCFAQYPDISLADLCTRDVVFAASLG